MIKKRTKIDDYISTNNNSNLEFTFGKLPKILHTLFNNNQWSKFDKNFSANIMKAEGFVLMGVNRCIQVHTSELCVGKNMNSERSFYTAILQYLDGTQYPDKQFWRLNEAIREYLKKDNSAFLSLNQGKIYSKFKTIVERKYSKNDYVHTLKIPIDNIIDEYIDYLSQFTNYTEIDFNKKHLIDIISKPGIIHKDGLNIIIFKQTPHKISDIQEGQIFIQCLEDIYIEDYYDENKKFIFLYEYDNETYEPIVLKKPKKQNDFALKKFFSINNVKYEILIKLLTKWFNKSCSRQFQSRKIKRTFYKLLTCKKAIEILEIIAKKDNKLEPKYIITDQSSLRSLYIITKGRYILPVKPSIYTKQTYPSVNLSYLNKYIDTYTNTKKYIEYINDMIQNEIKISSGYDVNSVIINKKNVTHIILESNLYIPIKKTKYKNTTKENIIELIADNVKVSVSNRKIYTKINKIVINGSEWSDYNDIQDSIHVQEIYHRMIFEFSEYINKPINNENKKNIIELIASSYNKGDKHKEYKSSTSYIINKQLYLKVKNLCSDIVISVRPKKEQLVDNDEIQVRKSCINMKPTRKGCVNDFCNLNDHYKCKLYVPNDKFRLFVGMIVSELLKYSKRQYNPEKNIYEIKVSGQILDNSISPIINVNLFKNYRNIVYERKVPGDKLLENIKISKDINI